MSREKYFAIACALLGAVLWVYVIGLCFACASRPAAREPESTMPALWCFAMEGKFKGQDATGAGCSSLREACEEARRFAFKIGGHAGLRSVGECEYTGGAL